MKTINYKKMKYILLTITLLLTVTNIQAQDRIELEDLSFKVGGFIQEYNEISLQYQEIAFHIFYTMDGDSNFGVSYSKTIDWFSFGLIHSPKQFPKRNHPQYSSTNFIGQLDIPLIDNLHFNYTFIGNLGVYGVEETANHSIGIKYKF